MELDWNLGLEHCKYTDQLLEAWTWKSQITIQRKLGQFWNWIGIWVLSIANKLTSSEKLGLGNHKSLYNKNCTVLYSDYNLALEHCNYTDKLLEAWSWKSQITKQQKWLRFGIGLESCT